MANYDDVASRWVNRALGLTDKGALSNPRMLDRGDAIFSYGTHFEIARIIRDAKGEPRHWLINGDRFSVTTGNHQRIVRGAISRSALPSVTIPHSALQEAGVELTSVQPIDVQEDWWTETVVTKPSDSVWRWEYDWYGSSLEDCGGWQNSLTGEFVAREHYGVPRPKTECDHEITVPGPWKPGWNWEHRMAVEKAREVHLRLHHGVWEEVSAHRPRPGRKRAVSGQRTEWELVNDPDDPRGFHLERVVRRHWLGGSLIRAQVHYTVQVKHDDCQGTGVAAEKWYTRSTESAIGPLTRDEMEAVTAQIEYRRVRYSLDEPLGWPYSVHAYVEHARCRGCGGTGRVPATRRRWAYFLSGFDVNETRPSYYFCEMPPKVKPETVEEALEMLKPAAVKLAEQAGREVKRQGDIFAIPMPGLTLRELKAQGGRHVKRPGAIVGEHGRLTWDGPRPNLLGTNHEATEVVYVGGQTYARGSIRHVPEGRRPDHKLTPLGREWHLIQKNTVPVSA